MLLRLGRVSPKSSSSSSSFLCPLSRFNPSISYRNPSFHLLLRSPSLFGSPAQQQQQQQQERFFCSVPHMSSSREKFLNSESDFLQEVLDFLNSSPSHFHAVEEAEKRLKSAGYTELKQKDLNWDLKPGNGYYIKRNQSAIVAFQVGQKYKPGNGFCMMGAHTDSPVLKLKPISKRDAHGYVQVGVQPYGGGLWNTWFDRDLSVAGRVIVHDEKRNVYECRLVDLKRPILRIPNLAIHLNRDIYTKGFNPNREDETVPILATAVRDKEVRKAAGKDVAEKKETSETEEEEVSFDVVTNLMKSHSATLLDTVAEELKVDLDQIREFELCLYDTQKAQLTGIHEEFIASRALDNLLMSSVCLHALLSAEGIEESSQVRVVALFDNEEVGSQSEQGADSNLLPELLRRINRDPAHYDAAIAKSVLVSADMAHALHPNYSSKHEANHRPAMHKGLVIKDNANQRYATSSVTAFYLSEIARLNKFPVQRFVVRNDMGCGSTIGPILSGKLGVATLDVGVAQLAMHSIRETCSARDTFTSYQLLVKFFESFEKLSSQCDF